MEMRDDDIVDILQDLADRDGKVIEWHRQVLLHRVGNMVGAAGNVDEAEGMPGSKPWIDEKCFAGVYQAIGCTTDLCDFHRM